MIVYSSLAITVLLSLLSFFLLRRGSAISLNEGWPYLLLSVGLAAFMYLYGMWVFISVYCKYVFGICFLVAAVVSLFRKKKSGVCKMKTEAIIAHTLLAVMLLLLVVLYFTGTTGKPYGVADLALPFKRGKYFVFQGGKGLPTNIFHYSGRRTLYALDIIKLNSTGNRAKHIFSSTLEDYEIFNDTIYSPCSGIILKTEDENPDNIPPLRKRGASNLNQVLIGTDAMYIFLGHLKQYGVFVKQGDTVVTGQPLGLAGNSGMSLEPHLHIQAHAKTNPNIPWYKEPQLLIKFDGKSYLLFEEASPLPSPKER